MEVFYDCMITWPPGDVWRTTWPDISRALLSPWITYRRRRHTTIPGTTSALCCSAPSGRTVGWPAGRPDESRQGRACKDSSVAGQRAPGLVSGQGRGRRDSWVGRVESAGTRVLQPDPTITAIDFDLCVVPVAPTPDTGGDTGTWRKAPGAATGCWCSCSVLLARRHCRQLCRVSQEFAVTFHFYSCHDSLYSTFTKTYCNLSPNF